jgi:hypothetical protein
LGSRAEKPVLILGDLDHQDSPRLGKQTHALRDLDHLVTLPG